MEKVIQVKNLSVAYKDNLVLSNINIDIHQGSMVAIVGPNGAGKSSLLHAMLGIIPQLSGFVRFFHEPYNRVKAHVAFVPQRSAVDWGFPITVYEVVKMGRYVHRKIRSKKLHHELIINALKMVDLEEYKDRQIGALSGGQQQRVFLARALAQEASLYILDEPLQGVDAMSEVSMMNVFKTLKQQGKTIIMIHHDLSTIEAYFDDVILLNKSVIAQGSVKDVFKRELIHQTYAHHTKDTSMIQWKKDE